MYQKIMVPLDGSKLAECVLPHLETVARGCAVPDIVLVRVVPPASPTVGDYALDPAQVRRIDEENKTVAEEYLHNTAKQLAVGESRVSTQVLIGREAESLADFATKNGFDLIIIATHGRSGVSRWVWGSVADRVLRSACVPVLMVRAPGCIPGF